MPPTAVLSKGRPALLQALQAEKIKEEAEDFKKQLEEAGGTVELK